MILPGLVSITFRHLSPQQIIELATRAGISGIEWGGDIHVPHGETATAREVLHATRQAGLEVAAYGSYYCVGHSEDEGLSFNHVLHTAIALEAPLIRVWAGKKNIEDADHKYFAFIAEETRHICEKAAKLGVQVAYEYHNGILTNTSSAARSLLDAVDHPNLRSLWQPITGQSTAENVAGLRELAPYLSNLHVYHWQKNGQEIERHDLAQGEDAWREYLSIAQHKNPQAWALMEFVPDDLPENFTRDAATLCSWLR